MRFHDALFAAASAGGEVPLTLDTTDNLFAFDARVGVTDDGSGLCSAWTDQGGGGNNASQGTSSKRPLITTSDGVPSLYFDGTNVLDVTLSSSPGVKTLYAVVNPTADASPRTIVGGMTGLASAGALNGRHHANDGSGWRDTGVPYASGLQRLTYEVSSAGGLQFRKDGVAATPATWTSDPSSTIVSIGCANGGGTTWSFIGHVLFVALYEGPRSLSVEDFLAQEWGV